MYHHIVKNIHTQRRGWGLTVWMRLTFALCDAAGVHVGRGRSLRAGLTLQLTLLVLVGTQPAARTLVMFQGEVRSHRTLDCDSTYN